VPLRRKCLSSIWTQSVHSNRLPSINHQAGSDLCLLLQVWSQVQ
jgi:hypothetical protein